MMHRKFQDRLNHVAVKTALVVLFGATSGMVQACSADTPYIGTVCYMAGNFCPEGYLTADGTLVPISTNQALYAIIGTTYGGDARTTFGLPDLRGRAVIGWGAATPQTTAVAFGAKRGTETVTLAANQVPVQQHSHPASFASGSSAPQASGNVSLPVAVTVPSQNISVSGNVKIANSTATGQQAVSASAVLAKGAGQATIYAPSSTAADTNIGPSQTFTGTTTATTVNAVAAGPASLPVSGGAITVGNNTVVPSNVPVSLIPPQQALTACIAANGIFPVRP